MNQTIIRLSLLLLLLTQIGVIHAQIEKGDLVKGKLTSSEIDASEKHQYTIKLEKNQFVFLKLMQQDIDLKVTTYNTLGEKLGEFDSPNYRNGFELFTLASDKKGRFVIEIESIDEKDHTGKYELFVQRVKPKAITQNGQVDELFTVWDTNDTPGAAIAVVKDGSIIYKNGYGLSNLEYDIPITPSSIFHIASISKQFTVFSILLLEKQGKLSLDDDIRKYIPEVPDFGTIITLRHLASHTSGLRDQWNLLSMAGWRMDDVITKEHILKLVSKQKELNFNPGEEYAYCNTGFTLLAEVVSRTSDMSFAEFTEVNIFEPLKMNNTLFYDDHEKIVKNRAYSYNSSSDGYKKSVLNYANVGATSLFTTVEDLALWSMNFSNLTVGDSTIVNKMNTTAILNNGKTFGGALGQFVAEYKGLNEIQHGGADAGYRSYLTRFPDENFAVIVFSNSAEFSSGRMAHKVVDIYLKDKIKTKDKQEEVKEEEESILEVITIDQNIVTTYVGDFELRPGFIIKISKKDGQLYALATGQSEVSLTPISTTEYIVEDIEAKVEFIPNGGENIKLFKLHQGGQIMDARRVEAFDKNSVNLSDFSGDFYSEELSTTYSFTIVDDSLVAKHSRLSDFNLSPLKTDIFTGEAWYFGQIDFIRDANNVITGCKVSNGRVRNLYFEKVN
ncbi:serine hydrolase domain-containing protein [uncultured Winogradskyella sp.]|uniref:serine hydrolase domain-containing protein n=1 Tax=uncultured Winogradskyella sp. TaxID=395353 RepID=UPI0030D78C56|tara:strand:- start:1846 stop:3858 length:2013 start_codon:yes stop_codon:yes gene_type:complete